MEKINLKDLKIGHHYKTPMGKKGYYLHTTKPNNFLGGDEIFYLHFVSKKGVHFTLVVTEQIVMESSGKDVLSVSDLVVHLEKLKANLKPYCDSKDYEKNCAAIDEAIRLYSGEGAEPRFFGVPASSFKAIDKDPRAKKNLEELRKLAFQRDIIPPRKSEKRFTDWCVYQSDDKKETKDRLLKPCFEDRGGLIPNLHIYNSPMKKLEWEMLVERVKRFYAGVDLVKENAIAFPQPDSLSVQVFGGYDRERHAEAVKKAKRELFNLHQGLTFNWEDTTKGLKEDFDKTKETKTEPTSEPKILKQIEPNALFAGRVYAADVLSGFTFEGSLQTNNYKRGYYIFVEAVKDYFAPYCFVKDWWFKNLETSDFEKLQVGSSNIVKLYSTDAPRLEHSEYLKIKEDFDKKVSKTEPTYLTTRNVLWFPKNTLVQLTKLKKWYTDLAIEGLIKDGYLILQ